jgi:hypothetical protein
MAPVAINAPSSEHTDTLFDANANQLVTNGRTAPDSSTIDASNIHGIVNSGGNGNGNHASVELNLVKTAQGIFMHFKDKGSKFNGEICQTLDEYIGDFQQACTSLGMPRDQRLVHMHNIFDGEAKRYFNRHIEGNN